MGWSRACDLPRGKPCAVLPSVVQWGHGAKLWRRQTWQEMAQAALMLQNCAPLPKFQALHGFGILCWNYGQTPCQCCKTGAGQWQMLQAP